MKRILAVCFISTIGSGLSFYFFSKLFEPNANWQLSQALMIGLGMTLFWCIPAHALADFLRIIFRLPIWTILVFVATAYLLIVLAVFLFMKPEESGLNHFSSIFEPFFGLWFLSLFYGGSYVVSLYLEKTKKT